MTIDEPPVAPSETSPAAVAIESSAPPLETERADGTLVIDLTRLVPPPPGEDCIGDVPDPLNPAIVVCETTRPSPRLGPMVGPVDESFGSAIPRARIKISDKAAAEANLHNTPVGGFNANGGEVRVKIDF